MEEGGCQRQMKGEVEGEGGCCFLILRMAREGYWISFLEREGIFLNCG